uniref:Uncharacterized protein n=1 Tax=virus sp. ctx9V1 TaxID=2828001 RepID=A0A8S5RD97_9VIRU|nr:MAG TPA: hypothetical protein [virus sp. ctx9V1]
MLYTFINYFKYLSIVYSISFKLSFSPTRNKCFYDNN